MSPNRSWRSCADLGYQLLWHFTGPCRHGADLIVLCPSGERVVAVEVKGTLRARYWPRLSRRELVQMSGAWIDKTDDPEMASWACAATTCTER